MMLDIEARIGELLPSREAALRGNIKRCRRWPIEATSKGTHVLSRRNDKQREARVPAHQGEPRNRRQDQGQAREKEDIPTKTAVLNAIHYEKERKESEWRGWRNPFAREK